MTMEQYKCSGWLFVTLDRSDLKLAGIHMTHYRSHPPYTDISISEEIARDIEKLKDLTAAKVSTISHFFGFSVLTVALDMADYSGEISKIQYNAEANLCTLGSPS